MAVKLIQSSSQYTLYHTSFDAQAPEASLYEITAGGVQTLTVSADNPLLLFDLTVSLEWNAADDTIFLAQLEQNLKDAAQTLYDWSNGQIALGKITVYQAKEKWDEADIQVLASNQVRPNAFRGGIVTDTVTLDLGEPVTALPGRIRIGSIWNRYGTLETITGDWAKVLAHEIAHYALFLEDTYLGIDEASNVLVPVESCVGSALTDPYRDDYSEFRYADGAWDAECGMTLAALPEWEILTRVYPDLQPPPPAVTGPANLPFAFAQIEIVPPTAEPPLADVSVQIEDTQGLLADGRAYLIQPGRGIVDLGRPVVNTIQARGAQVGDTVCVFSILATACDEFSPDQPPRLTPQAAWQPQLALRPVTSTTLELQIDGAADTVTATIYPDNALPVELSLMPGQSASVNLPATANVLVDLRGSAPNQRQITGYTLGSGPGRTYSYGGPFTSGDGGLSVFPPENLADEDFMVLQLATRIPDLPTGLLPIGRAYDVRASTALTDYLRGSLTYQYLGMDVLLSAQPEGSLAIHYHDGETWQRLDTVLNQRQNFASASLPGPGVYALTAGVVTPEILAVDPPSSETGITHTLTITGARFVKPLAVTAVGDSTRLDLTVGAVTSQTVTAELPSALPADLYDIELTLRGGVPVTSTAAVAVYTRLPETACLFEDFHSGLGRWQLAGNWGTVRAGDVEGVTDSPGVAYPSAPPGQTLTATLTSRPFDLSACADAQLTLHHALDLLPNDVATIEITTDGGQNWVSVYQQAGTALAVRAAQDDEWTGIPLQTTVVDLSTAGIPLDATTAQLRLRLMVDDRGSGRGWLVGEIVVGENSQRN
ncbi:MAG: hypothetical protein R2873_04550 [Caldilineaceae bacterium]